MYLRILKKDLKRKKTMNLILLIFIILASTFISSSANNMFSVMTALDSFFNKAEVPDYWFSTTILEDAEKYKTLARTENYDYKCQELIQIDPAKIRVNDKKLSYSNTVCISPLKNSIKIFHEDDSELTKINDGEIYLTGDIFHSEKIKTGDKLSISLNGRTKTFTVAGGSDDDCQCVSDYDFHGYSPLAVLAVTVLAGILASLQIRKIAVSETSNIE